MAQITWVGSATGNWFAANNWSTDTVPGSGDTVLITLGGAYSISVAAPVVVGALTLANGGATLALHSNFSVRTGLTDEAGLIQLDPHTILRVGGVSSFGVAGQNGPSVQGPGTLLTTGAISFAQGNVTDLYLGQDATWINDGAASVGGSIVIGTSYNQSATLMNGAGATINLLSDDANIVSYGNSGTSTFVNAGLLEKTGASGTSSTVSSYVINVGTIRVSLGDLEFSGGGDFAGIITGSGTIGFSGGISELTSKAVGIANVLVNGGYLYDTVSLPGSLSVTGGTLDVAASIRVGRGLNATGGTIELEPSVTLGVLGATSFGLSAGPAATIDGYGTLVTIGAVSLATQTSSGNYDLYIGENAEWVNDGSAFLGGGIVIGSYYNQSATLMNGARATLDLLSDNANIVSYGSSGTSTFVNAGLLEKTGSSGGSSTISSYLTNVGTIRVTIGDLEFSGGGSFGGIITGAGTIGFSGGVSDFTSRAVGIANVSVDGGYVYDTATLPGSLSVSSGTFEVAANVRVGRGLTQTGGTIELDSNDTLAVGGTTTLGVSGGGAATIDGAGTLITAGAVLLATRASSTNYDLYLGGGAKWVNDGSAFLGGGIVIGSYYNQAATLVNAAGATFNLLSDNANIVSYGNSGTSTFLNAGLLEKTGSAGASSTISSYLVNAGTIRVASGDLEFSGGGNFGGIITGSGTIGFSGGISNLRSGADGIAHVSVDGGTVYLSSSLAGSLSVTSGTLDVIDGVRVGHGFTATGGTTDLAPSGTLFVAGSDSFGVSAGNAATIDGPGTLITTGFVTLATQANPNTYDLYLGQYATWINDSGALVGGGIVIGSSYNQSATIVNGAGGTFNLLNDSADIVTFGSSGTSTFINNGLLEKTGSAGGESVVSSYLTNNGTVRVTSGTLDFSGFIANSTYQALVGGTWEAFGSTLLLDNGYAIIHDDADIILAGAASTIVSGGTTIDASLVSISAGGALQLLGGRNFTTTSVFVDAGRLQLGASTFTARGLAIESTGILAGYGTVKAGIANAGSIIASGGVLNLASAGSLGDITGTTLTRGGLGATANATLQLANNTFIAVDDSSISLTGVNCAIQSFDTATRKEVTLDTTLHAVGSTGTLALLDGRSFRTVAAGGTFSLQGTLRLGGGVFAATRLLVFPHATLSGFGTVDSALTNASTVEAVGGSLTFGAAVLNAGVIATGANRVAFDGAVSGNGTVGIGLGGTALFSAASATTQHLDFLGKTGLLDLAAPKSFASTIAGFGNSDRIDLLSTAANTGTFAAGVLDVKHNAATVATLRFSGAYATKDFHFSGDGHGGTLISFV